MTIPSHIRRLLLVVLVTTGLTRAHAVRFDYSYLFADGLSITGSFDNGTSFFDGAFALDLVQGLSGTNLGSWSLTRSTAVPDASATVVLCALGLLPLLLLRRRVLV